jgi:hypothetical protein
VSAETPRPRPPAKIDPLKPLRAIVRRAQGGNAVALAQLRQVIDHPSSTAVFRDLVGRVRAALTRRLAGDDVLSRELVEREMARVRAELLGPAPSAVERLLVERVAIGWLELHTAEVRLAMASGESTDDWQRQVNHAHRRFQAAVRLLTAVRPLPRPAVQVNIAEQQVNVSG